MARRWEHTPEELKNLAIQAGYDLIAERGFQAFSARAVATKMGYTVGTLYHVFGDLDNFILHINARTLDEWYDIEVKGMPKREEQHARYFAHSYYSYARDNYNRWLALFEHRMQDNKPIPKWYMPKMMRMFALIGDAVLPHVDNDAKKAERLAKLLWASVHGITTLSLSGKLDQVHAGTPEKMIDDLMSVALAGK